MDGCMEEKTTRRLVPHLPIRTAQSRVAIALNTEETVREAGRLRIGATVGGMGIRAEMDGKSQGYGPSRPERIIWYGKVQTPSRCLPGFAWPVSQETSGVASAARVGAPRVGEGAAW